MQLSDHLLLKDREDIELMLRHYQKLLLTNKPNRTGRQMVQRQIRKLKYRLSLPFFVAA